MKNKELFLITTYAPDNNRQEMLRNFVNSIDREVYDIMVTSHSSIPSDIIDNINYFIYDSENILLTDVEFKYSMYYDTDLFRVISTENRPFNHTLAALKLVTLGLSTAKNEGYKKVHCIEYDTDLKSDQEFVENSKLLDEYSLVYYATDYTPTIISFPVSFNLDRISSKWLEFNKEYLQEWVANDPYKTIENYEIQLIEKENSYPKSYKKLYENGVIINLHYSGGEDVWVVPVVNNSNELLIFSWNKSNTLDIEDIPVYNIKMVVNGEKYLGWDNPLNHWYLKSLGNFDDINTLTIIRNNKRIINYDFNSIDRSKFKESNFIESFE